MLPKYQNLEDVLDDNQERGSVADTSSPSEDNYTTVTPSISITREISSGFCPQKKVCGTQSQRSLTHFFPHENILYKNKVVVQEVHYSTYYVLVPDK